MGVKGLWAECKPVAQTKSLIDWAVEESIRLNGRQPVLGIDANNLLDSVIAASSKRERFHTDGIVGSLLASILPYTNIPAILLFVFDGHRNFKVKSGKKVINKNIATYSTARQLIQAVGGYILNGPGEADVQLAALSQQGIVDAVISDDSDMIVHGVDQVLRYDKEKTKNTKRIFVQAYHFSDVRKHLDADHTGLLLIATLSGNSYAEGLRGCSIKTALELAHCGFGETLVAWYKSDPKLTLDKLGGWKKGVKFELETNSTSRLSSRHPAIASRIHAFSPLNALSGYLYPARLPSYTRIDHYKAMTPTPAALEAYSFIKHGFSVDSLDEESRPGNAVALVPKEVSIPMVRDFCMTYLHWNEDTIVQYLSKKLWTGVIIQMLCLPFLIYSELDTGNPRMPSMMYTPWHKVQFLSFPKKRKEEKYPCSNMAYIRIVFGIEDFLQRLKMGTPELAFNEDTALHEVEVWVPVQFLPWMLPNNKATDEEEVIRSGLSSEREREATAYNSDTIEVEDDITYLYTQHPDTNYITF
ncbi:hypothetical protein E1B28_003774 [Marasmius oreades]|uniref:XPG-I domain-containing protein n=1 Tax=Marasmius oreades TaxID=181124 RepID=A0A9P8AC21_9AGAR|nr:uncharacterized protein E1B28_003774 [Marasmius oreades]KAG7096330.1 hypothetical protein E1B28_003774 [Marasmius oreades]